ncbi:hypothetical protein [Allopontixanthobacter sp.]|uniref:hypothetical protein n=1 Tax=Allopontixanthobacter sp. TaxID=2906452 RepID=UPI002ABC7680|nr:hypothetical protein [Allopontixanthobacter sp.]MDZ4307554.1 hypothetical protein [Allopontixanthobacter sp.]
MGTISGFSRPVTTAVIPGGVVGDHAVPGGIKDGDTLVAVTQLTDAVPPVPTDRTAEFSISAGTSDQVENTTTDTTGAFLVVTWVKAE